MAAQLLMEAAAWCALAGAIVGAAVTLTGVDAPTDGSRVAAAGARVLVIGLTGCLFGVVSTVLAMRERQLFAYFKAH
jgi:hypothetical protein